MKSFITRGALALAFIAFISVPFISYAALTDQQISSVTALLRSFGTDDAMTQSVYITLQGGAVLGTATADPYPAYCPQLTRTLQRGSRDATTGGQVTQLQKFFSGYYDLNPADIVTGYFGVTTHNLVLRFQREQGLSQVGIVGVLTRAKIAEVCGSATSGGTTPPTTLTPLPPPSIITPPIACPLIAWVPIECNGTLKPKYDTRGCQSGWECTTATSTPATASLSAVPTSGTAPLTVTFSGDTGAGCGGGYFTLNYGDGQSDQIAIPADSCRGTFSKTHTYTSAGGYTATLGAKGGTRTVSVKVGSAPSPTAVFLKEPMQQNATYVVGTPIPIAWHVEYPPSNSQILIHLKGINTSGGIGGGTWASSQLPAGQSNGTYSWPTGSGGYLNATGQYSVTLYVVACETQGCSYNYDAQGGLGRTQYAKSGPVYIDVLPAGTPTAQKSYPIVAGDYTLSSIGVEDGRLLRFKVSANSSGPISFGKFTISVNATGASVSNVGLFAYEDGSFSTPISGVGFDGGIPQLAPSVFAPNAPIHIPAGATRYFEVRGSVSGATAATAVTTTLRGDTSGTGVGTFSVQKEKGYFTWSPNTSQTPTYSTSDWTNGYLVPGLPSGGIMQTRSGVWNTTTTTPSLPTPVINSFTASPSSVTAGQSSTLMWSASNVQYGGCYLFAGGGSASITPSSNWGASGSFSATPSVTTTYKLWCTSSWKDGSPTAEKTVTVTVNTPPPPPPPTGSGAVTWWKAYTFSTLASPSCSGSRYIGYSAKYNAWVGAIHCGLPTKYKLYMSSSEKGTYYQIADYSGHGQDHCELVNPTFSLSNDDDITSGGCLTCALGNLVDVQNEQVFVRSRLGEAFSSVTSRFWADLTTSWYSCGVPIEEAPIVDPGIQVGSSLYL